MPDQVVEDSAVENSLGEFFINADTRSCQRGIKRCKVMCRTVGVIVKFH